ncbi:uncharacterized protein [Centruroides vittatus]|uniref:uncharacterized protein n=1 Tax=Centruroides vittatus TaxID=120091 RepID=UPI003510CFC5
MKRGNRFSPPRRERNFKDKGRDFHRFNKGNIPDRDRSPLKNFENYRRGDSSGSAQMPFRDHFDSQPNDCEIVVSRQQRIYAESIETRLKNIGFRVDILFLKEDNLLVQTVDDISERGCLYAMVITPQNEIHNSVTLNILHGRPQEHRNMPIDDAIKLIARNYHEYIQNQREKMNLNAIHGQFGNSLMKSPETQFLLNMLADGRFLTIVELEVIINYLGDVKNKLLGIDKSKEIISGEQGTIDQPVMSPNMLNMVNPVQVPSVDISGVFGNKEDPKLMQTEINPVEPVNSTYINFNNPNVQKALDNLMQNSSCLLRNFSLNSGLMSNIGNENTLPVQNPDTSEQMSAIMNRENLMNDPNNQNLLGSNKDFAANKSLLGSGPAGINKGLLGSAPINQSLLGSGPIDGSQNLLGSRSDLSAQSLLGTGPGGNLGLLGSRPPGNQNPLGQDTDMLGPRSDIINQGLLGTRPDVKNSGLLGTRPDSSIQGLLGSRPDGRGDNQGLLGSRPDGNNQGLLGSRPDGNQGLLGTRPEGGNSGLLGSRPDTGNQNFHNSRSGMNNQNISGSRGDSSPQGLLGSRPDNNQSLLGSRPEFGNQSLLGSRPDFGNQSLLGSRPASNNQSLLGPRPHFNARHRF